MKLEGYLFERRPSMTCPSIINAGCLVEGRKNFEDNSYSATPVSTMRANWQGLKFVGLSLLSSLNKNRIYPSIDWVIVILGYVVG